MKILTLLVTVSSLAFGLSVANGQRVGGASPAPRAGGVMVQAGPAGGHVHGGSGFAPSVIAPTAPRGAFIPSPNFHSHAPAPVFVAPIAPQPHFRGPYWPRQPAIVQPGIVIIDVPYYSEGIEITQTAPGVVQQERRFDERPTSETRTRAPGQLAPFDPTPGDVVERMLKLASVRSGDVLYDLGAGDGRVAIAAAKKFGVRAVGYEIDPGLVKLARENVRKQGVEHLVEIRQQDFLSADLTSASVVMLYLSYDGNLALRGKLMYELKPGARVVSYTFDMAEWQAKIAERYRDDAGNTHMIYLWQIGEPLAFR
jgi:precorrin-6B methylase 2